MQKHFKLIITISLFCLIINLFKYPFQVFSQNEVTNVMTNSTWIGKRDNLNITIKIITGDSNY